MNQEHGDARWVLRVCDVHGRGRLLRVVLRRRVRAADRLLPRRRPSAGHGRRLAAAALRVELDTETPGQAADGRLACCTPSSRTIVRRTARDAQRSTCTMFSDRRQRRPTTGSSGRRTATTWSMRSRRGGVTLRAGKHRSASASRRRGRTTREALADAKRVAGDRGPRRPPSDALDDGPSTTCIPLSHLRAGMEVLVERRRPVEPPRSTRSSSSPTRAGVRPRGRRHPHLRGRRDAGAQLVYGFRGADIRNILEFEKAFPDVTTVVLEQNYRSTQTILDAANVGDRQQRRTQAQDAVDRQRHGRPHRPLPRRGRGRRGRLGRRHGPPAARRRR